MLATRVYAQELYWISAENNRKRALNSGPVRHVTQGRPSTWAHVTQTSDPEQ